MEDGPNFRNNRIIYIVLAVAIVVMLFFYFFYSQIGFKSTGGYMANQISSPKEFQLNVVKEKNAVLIIFFNKDSPLSAVEALSNAASAKYPNVKNYSVNLSEKVLSREEVETYVGSTPLVCCTGKCNDVLRRVSQPEPDEPAFKDLMSWLNSCTITNTAGKDSTQ
jgi:hypothetical protein